MVGAEFVDAVVAEGGEDVPVELVAVLAGGAGRPVVGACVVPLLGDGGHGGVVGLVAPGFDLGDEAGECFVGLFAGASDGAGDPALAPVGGASGVDLDLPAAFASCPDCASHRS